jgi:hypothetical protein
VAGAVLSLIFSYVPWLRGKFEGLAPNVRRGVMIGLLLATTVGLAVNACQTSGCLPWTQWLWMFGAAVLGNQGTWLISPKLNH